MWHPNHITEASQPINRNHSDTPPKSGGSQTAAGQHVLTFVQFGHLKYRAVLAEVKWCGDFSAHGVNFCVKLGVAGFNRAVLESFKSFIGAHK
jgi:hypothetical protein